MKTLSDISILFIFKHYRKEHRKEHVCTITRIKTDLRNSTTGKK